MHTGEIRLVGTRTRGTCHSSNPPAPTQACRSPPGEGEGSHHSAPVTSCRREWPLSGSHCLVQPGERMQLISHGLAKGFQQVWKLWRTAGVMGRGALPGRTPRPAGVMGQGAKPARTLRPAGDMAKELSQQGLLHWQSLGEGGVSFLYPDFPTAAAGEHLSMV